MTPTQRADWLALLHAEVPGFEWRAVSALYPVFQGKGPGGFVLWLDRSGGGWKVRLNRNYDRVDALHKAGTYEIRQLLRKHDLLNPDHTY